MMVIIWYLRGYINAGNAMSLMHKVKDAFVTIIDIFTVFVELPKIDGAR